jgi:hypothetical protein
MTKELPMSSLRFPNVDEFTVELDGTPSWTDPRGRRWGSIREASLWNYPNEGDELLRDHRAWLDENVVAALAAQEAGQVAAGLALTCRLLGSASNDMAGVAHNLQVAGRRARKARAYLLGKGVAERQIVEVESSMDISVRSTAARDRHVDVFLQQPVDTIFAIRKVVLAAGSSLLPWGAVHFFEIRPRAHRLSAFYVLARNRPFNTGPAPGFALGARPGFDFVVTAPALVSVQDFDGADMMVFDAPSDDPASFADTTFAEIDKPGHFLSVFPMPEFERAPSDPSLITGKKLFLVRGPEEPTL